MLRRVRNTGVFVTRGNQSGGMFSAPIFNESDMFANLWNNLEDAIIASNANIGGPTTAAGMAISQGWAALVGPAMLIGTLGCVVGNYLGTIVGIALGL